MYTYKLEVRPFPIAEEAFKTWCKTNIPNYICAGYDLNALEIARGIQPTYMDVVFSEQPSYEYLTALDDHWASLEDDGSYEEERDRLKALAVEEQRIQFGIKVRAFLGYLCEKHNYTPVEYGQMLVDNDLATCSNLLTSGALESCKAIIDAYTPTSYFTVEMQEALSNEFQKYIDLINAM